MHSMKHRIKDAISSITAAARHPFRALTADVVETVLERIGDPRLTSLLHDLRSLEEEGFPSFREEVEKAIETAVANALRSEIEKAERRMLEVDEPRLYHHHKETKA